MRIWKSCRRAWRYLSEFYHRGRYGWAPSDTWSLDIYVARVLGGGLMYLADHTHGAPHGYPRKTPSLDDRTDHDKWEEDLRRWGNIFKDYASLWEEDENGILSVETEDLQYKAVKQALRELTPWFGALWD